LLVVLGVWVARVGVGTGLSLRCFLEQALLVWCIWAWRLGKWLRRGSSPLSQPRGLQRAVRVPGAIATYRRSVGVVGIEASALAGGSGTRPRRIRASPPPVCFVGRRVPGAPLPLVQWRVSACSRRGRLRTRWPVRVRIGKRDIGGACRRRGERGHGRRAREGRLTRTARRVCSRRGAPPIAALLYPQGPNGGYRGRVGVVVSQEELLLRAALLPAVHCGRYAAGYVFTAANRGSPRRQA
jgi:hypothetical protein